MDSSIATNNNTNVNKSIVLPPLSSILNSPIPPLTITSTPRKPNEKPFASTPMHGSNFRSNSFTLPLPTPSNMGLNGMSNTFFQSHSTPNIFSTPSNQQRPNLPSLSTLLPTPQTNHGDQLDTQTKNKMDLPKHPIDPNTSVLSDSSFQSLGSPTSNSKSQKRSVCGSGTNGDEEKTFAFISHNPKTYLSSEPSIDNAQLARRKRRRTSPTELKVLAEEFERNKTPDRVNRDRIARAVNMSEKAVQIWFQNKRQALRKLQRKGSNQTEMGSPSDIANPGAATSLTESQDTMTEHSNTSTESLVSEGDFPPSGVFTNNPTQQTSQESLSRGGQMFKFKATAYGLVAPAKSKSRRQKPTMKLKVKNGGPLVDITNIHNGQRILSGL